MSHPAPSNADPIRLTAARLPREARNSLISSVLEPNLMPFVSGTPFFEAWRTENQGRPLITAGTSAWHNRVVVPLPQQAHDITRLVNKHGE